MINVHFNIQTNYLCVWVIIIGGFQIRFKYTIYNRRIMFSYIITNNIKYQKQFILLSMIPPLKSPFLFVEIINIQWV